MSAGGIPWHLCSSLVWSLPQSGRIHPTLHGTERATERASAGLSDASSIHHVEQRDRARLSGENPSKWRNGEACSLLREGHECEPY